MKSLPGRSFRKNCSSTGWPLVASITSERKMSVFLPEPQPVTNHQIPREDSSAYLCHSLLKHRFSFNQSFLLGFRKQKEKKKVRTKKKAVVALLVHVGSESFRYKLDAWSC